MYAAIRSCLLLLALVTGIAAPSGATEHTSSRKASPTHALAMHGAPKYPEHFQHFDYVNPDAPKGGILRMTHAYAFNSLNPFIMKGIAAPGLAPLGSSYLYASLMVQSKDEPFTEYGYLAESVELADDRSWVAFNLRPQATFHDGTPVMADDVVFSFNTLREKGRPLYRSYWGNITRVEATGPRRVLFTFDGTRNRELPLILGQLPVFSRADWNGHDFERSGLRIPLGNGPYRIATVESGRRIVWERVENWWGHTVPALRGHYNFDTIRVDIYQDDTVAKEALKAGKVDIRIVRSAREWARDYPETGKADSPLTRIAIKNHSPSGMQGFVFNTRRPHFADPKVREALIQAFDFEWTNANLSFGLYKRTRSYFGNSDLEATGEPGPEERILLEPWRDQIPARVFRPVWEPPRTDTPGGLRANLKRALTLLDEAGYEVRNNVMVSRKTGQPLTFEILLHHPAWEKVTRPLLQNLSRLGIHATMRTIDPAQHLTRRNQYDYDMIVDAWFQSLSPGNEQYDFFASHGADNPGGRNLAGIRNPAVDAMIGKMVQANTRTELVAASRALDRILRWSFLCIPQWYNNETLYVATRQIQTPEMNVLQPVIDPDIFWYAPQSS
ncbi:MULTISPECIES: extracellular solute-binding protein [unclassified Haematospirillum]|uniref:extracellular solute-binding protein n=1 Tax=unclassified Haematospirillum TaxID=2622088 RepID=UPI00143A8947|nr:MULTISPECIES: extracellular solute-binding protein [unclassified Haematospirillum]NKD55096.1 ABC transporter substrate-binding protein [Haematospirillum sp. H4890]NKD75349.1 ABC transporter substrate-binding protein [Haematospirillum sp. H4485]